MVPTRDGTTVSRVTVYLLVAALFSLLYVRSAGAQSTFDPYATLRVEHDSNVYRVVNSTEAAVINYGDPTLADTDWRYIVGVDGTYLWDRQKLIEKLEFSRIDYAHFTDLNHYEYLGSVELDWLLGSLFDGALQLKQQRLQAPFQNNDSTQLTVNTERTIAETFNVRLDPEWRLETGVRYYHLDSPLQFYPDYEERDAQTDLGIKYLGVAKIVCGITYSRLDGRFYNAPNVAPYTQNAANVNIAYSVSGLTTVTAAAGYTHREQGTQAGNVSAVTGELYYKRALTGKTSVLFELSRAVNSYLAAGGSEIDSTARAGLTWQATYKIAATVGYSFMRSVFVGQVIPNSAANGRVDNIPAATANVTYQAFHHVLFQAYSNVTTRRSNIDYLSFSDTLLGISVTGHWK